MALIFSNPPFNIFEERKTQKAPWSDFSWLDLSIYGQNIQYLRFPNRSFGEEYSGPSGFLYLYMKDLLILKDFSLKMQ